MDGSIGFSTENVPKVHLPSKINLKKKLEHRVNFFEEKWNFMN